jgi:hypothetical protein
MLGTNTIAFYYLAVFDEQKSNIGPYGKLNKIYFIIVNMVQ